MASGPYQSNLLRFVVRQYWQGLARHQRAVRQTRSTIALGSELGVAVLLSPVIMAARASKRRLQQLKQSVSELRLSLEGGSEDFSKEEHISKELFEFSGFDRLSAVSDRLDGQALTSTDAMPAEVAMVRTLLAVGESLSSSQRAQLEGCARRPLIVRWWRSVQSVLSARSLSARLQRQSAQSIAVSENQLRRPGETDGLTTVGKITGVASDLETRSLVLIRDYCSVWDGLNEQQQRQLQHQIEALLAESGLTIAESGESMSDRSMSYVSGEVALLSEGKLTKASLADVESAKPKLTTTDLSEAESPCDLAVPTVSFWVEVLRAVAWLKRRIAVGRRLPTRQLRLSGAAVLEVCGSVVAQLGHATTKLRGWAITRLPSSGLVRQKRERNLIEQVERGNSEGCVDASVVTVSYVEHPLEKVLKWIDRCLLWLEASWRQLMNWLRR